MHCILEVFGKKEKKMVAKGSVSLRDQSHLEECVNANEPWHLFSLLIFTKSSHSASDLTVKAIFMHTCTT